MIYQLPFLADFFKRQKKIIKCSICIACICSIVTWMCVLRFHNITSKELRIASSLAIKKVEAMQARIRICDRF